MTISSENTANLGFDAALLFGQSGVESQTKDFLVFPYTGTPRWLLEARFRRPWHLKTWPRVNRRAKIIYTVAWLLSFFGVSLPARKIKIHVAPDSLYATLSKEFDHLGIFLGTPGLSQKVVIYAGRGKNSVFVKVPLGPVSYHWIEREALALKMLGTDPRIASMIPNASRVAGHLACEDLGYRGAKYQSLPPYKVAHVHDLLFSRSVTTISLTQLKRDWHKLLLEKDFAGVEIQNLEPVQTVIDSCRNAAEGFLSMLDPDLPVECYEAHGDFTRWNVLASRRGEPLVLDWEMFGMRPRYFDIIHYYVSNDILVLRLRAEDILKQLNHIAEEVGLMPTWYRYVGLYFAFQAITYCTLYARQSELHPQAIWQMVTWQAALENITAFYKREAEQK